MKDPRPRLSTGDGAILLGVALLLFSIAGLVIDSATLKMRNMHGSQPASAGKVIRRVYQPPPPPGQGMPTLTPFQVPPTLAPVPADPAAPAAEVAPGAIFAPDNQVDNNAYLVPGALPTAVPPPEAEEPPEAALQAMVPQRIAIPAIQLDAPVRPSGYMLVEINGQVYQQWEAPTEYAAGWQQTSAYLGVPGNTVLNGHHNIFGSVFGRLIDLAEGDAIEVYSGDSAFLYTITNKMILPENGEDLSVRLENGRWMQSTTDERLTLVTCWPPESNTHRLLIVAQPVDKRIASSGEGP